MLKRFTNLFLIAALLLVSPLVSVVAHNAVQGVVADSPKTGTGPG